ncbi:hypothetical protein [Pseudolactococcus insecticola]|uniref:Lipoprotein n=1 Tax=Pseudolactococcus insecticola TaxID=2709158 RepID=A0A6A0BBQ7_9LACT|nr:hypothetical protein [Lactococcus insecticola]GFH41267.1 hypothetical protein Hs20B_16650 [Lactococcus insecticola]
MKKNPVVIILLIVSLVAIAAVTGVMTYKNISYYGDKSIKSWQAKYSSVEKQVTKQKAINTSKANDEKIVTKDETDDYSDVGYDLKYLDVKTINDRMTSLYNDKKSNDIKNIEAQKLFSQADTSFKFDSAYSTISSASGDGFEGFVTVKYFAFKTGSDTSKSDMTPSYDVYAFSSEDGKTLTYSYLGTKVS